MTQQHPHPHEHPHDHSHSHPQVPATPAPVVEAHNAAAGQGAVVLDIGEGTGALVLYADASAAGLEIEISPEGADSTRHHVAVLPRPAMGSEPGHPPLHAAVYPTLPAGTWNLWHPFGDIALTLDIRDGEITEAHWPT